MSSGDGPVVDYHLALIDCLVSHLDTVLAILGTTSAITKRSKHFPKFYVLFLTSLFSERRPLVASHPSTPPIDTSFRSSNSPVTQPTPRWAQPPRFDVNGSARNYSYGSVTMPYADRGWFEYQLPHGLRYFGNPRKSATTDLDLRNFSKLDQVTNTIDTADSVPEGCEIWIRPSYQAIGWGRRKTPGRLVIYWVDHRYRRILSEVPSDDLPVSGEDDSEFSSYFVDVAGAHNFHVLQGLMTSSDTGPTSRCTLLMSFSRPRRDRRLPMPFIGRIRIGFFRIPSPSNLRLARRNVRNSLDSSMVRHAFYIVLPFLMSLCRSWSAVWSFIHAHGRANSVTSRYVLFCIGCTESPSYLVHAAHWRQVHFRPHRPLPRDISHMHTAKRTPILRTVLEIVVGILCLGIPFLFVDRARYSSHFDVENNTAMPSSAPLFVIGACSCLVVRTAFIY